MCSITGMLDMSSTDTLSHLWCVQLFIYLKLYIISHLSEFIELSADFDLFCYLMPYCIQVTLFNIRCQCECLDCLTL